MCVLALTMSVADDFEYIYHISPTVYPRFCVIAPPNEIVFSATVVLVVVIVFTELLLCPILTSYPQLPAATATDSDC